MIIGKNFTWNFTIFYKGKMAKISPKIQKFKYGQNRAQKW